jgi:hypothetical protein
VCGGEAEASGVVGVTGCAISASTGVEASKCGCCGVEASGVVGVTGCTTPARTGVEANLWWWSRHDMPYPKEGVDPCS